MIPYEFNPSTQIAINRIELQKLRLGCQYVIDAMEFSEQARLLAQESMVLSLRSHVLAEKLVEDTYTDHLDVPANAWEMFKERHAPAWFVRRFPVRYDRRTVTVRFERYATYPDAAIRVDPKLGRSYLYEMATPLHRLEAA